MRFKKTVITLLASSLLIGTAVAKPGQGMRGGHHGLGMGALQQLELSEEQQSQIDALMEQMRASHQAQRDAMRAQHETFMSNAEFDQLTAEQLIEQKEQLRAANQLERMQMEHQLYQILTEEQRAELKQLQEERAQKMQERKGKKGKRGERGERKGDYRQG